MYTLKQLPEDFIVRERSTVKPQKTGYYLYLRLTKRERTIFDVVKELAAKLKIKEKDIGFAGSKDKQAVTEQILSIRGRKQEAIETIQLRGVTLQPFGYGHTPISLGDLEGNAFIIIVRNLDNVQPEKIHCIPNYFDEQRFSLHNKDIGKHLVQKQFKEAAARIQEPSFQEQLQKAPNNPIGALQRLPIRLLRMYISAYQSYLWNETLAAYLRKNGKVLKEVPYSLGTFIFVSDEEKFQELEIPLIGFDSEKLGKDEEIKDSIAPILAKEGLLQHDFIIKQFPDITPEGELRKAFIEVKDLSFGSIEKDELNPGKKKITVRFFLPKGSYATMVIRKLFS